MPRIGDLQLSNTIAAAIPPPDRQAVTRLLSAWQSGDTRALERLTPLIYEELRNRARRYMKRCLLYTSPSPRD